MFVFDARSIELLAKTDNRLATVMYMAIRRSPLPFRIVQSSRTIEQQRAYFAAGTSRVNPDDYDDLATLYRKAKHITGPGMPLSRAVDVAMSGRDPYDKTALRNLSELVKGCAFIAKVEIRWGGDFTSIVDMPHFELA